MLFDETFYFRAEPPTSSVDSRPMFIDKTIHVCIAHDEPQFHRYIRVHGRRLQIIIWYGTHGMMGIRRHTPTFTIISPLSLASFHSYTKAARHRQSAVVGAGPDEMHEAFAWAVESIWIPWIIP